MMTTNRSWHYAPIDVLGAGYTIVERCLLSPVSVVWVCRDQYDNWTYITYISGKGWDYSTKQEITTMTKRRITHA